MEQKLPEQKLLEQMLLKWNKKAERNKSKNNSVPRCKLPKAVTLKGFKDGCTDFGTRTKVAKGNTSPLATFVF